jgi:hypothetical protein
MYQLNIAPEKTIEYDNLGEKTVKTNKQKSRQHHITVYAGYDDVGEAKVAAVIKAAKKKGMSKNKFVWYCLSVVSGVDLITKQKRTFQPSPFKK